MVTDSGFTYITGAHLLMGLMSDSPSTILGNINLHSHFSTDSNWSLSSDAKAESMVSDYYGRQCAWYLYNG